MAGDDTSVVRLSDRCLAEIPEDVLLKCYDIRVLDLSENPGIRLNSFLRQFENVRRLELRRCALRGVPDDIYELTQLEELYLSNNRFRQGLNPQIGRLHRLVKLDLVGCGLKSLPESVGDLELLEELYLSRNDFSDGLPLVISRLYGLKELDLAECGITNVPESLGDLQLLINLNLSSNKLECYSPCFLNMKKLETLDVSTNSKSNEGVSSGIKKLPFKLAETRLRVLRLDGNPITEPPGAIWQQGLEAIKSYFRETSYGTDNVCPDTINMVGNVAAGKTSIANYLEKGSPDPAKEEDRTHVMQRLKASIVKNSKRFVNINDFAGHKIYHSVIPIFLPTDGLVILAFNIFTEKKEQEEALTHWLLTVIAKSKQIRLLVVGTHADLVSPEMLNAAAEGARKIVDTVLQKAKDDVKLHIHKLQHLAINLREKKLEELRDLLMRLEKAIVSIFTVSCTEPDPNEGMRSLAEEVLSQLKPPQIMPRRWFEVMKDITDPPPKNITNASPGRPYIDLKEAQDIYRMHIPDVAGYSDLEVILRYLVSTSQIIWLERHDELGNLIFYSPQIIIDVCKKVLDHDRARPGPDGWEEQFSEDIKRYQNGIVHQPFMEMLLAPCEKDAAETVVNFLKHFNLISELRKSPSKDFVIPSNLPIKEPQELCGIKQCLEEYGKSVVIRLYFSGSLVPVSFFETSISSILTVAYGLPGPGVDTVQWCNGVIIPYNGVFFASWRERNIVHLASYSEHSDRLWTLLEPVLKRLHDNVTHYWHGATPECRIVCPGCRSKARNEQDCVQITTTLEILASHASPSQEPSCGKCVKTIPQRLCFPPTKGVSDQRATQAAAVELLDSASNGTTEQLWQESFQSKYDFVSSKLSLSEVRQIVRELYSNRMILPDEKDHFLKDNLTPTEAAEAIMSIIMRRNRKDIYCAFIKSLQGMGRNDLVDALRPSESLRLGSRGGLAV